VTDPSHPDLSAWLDGALDPAEAERVAEAVRTDPATAHVATQLRQAREHMRRQGPARAPTGFADRVLSKL